MKYFCHESPSSGAVQCSTVQYSAVYSDTNIIIKWFISGWKQPIAVEDKKLSTVIIQADSEKILAWVEMTVWVTPGDQINDGINLPFRFIKYKQRNWIKL